jgi:hypothetical protein
MTLYPYANVLIYSTETIEEVAALLSQKLFDEIPFSGKELGLFEEVPALRLEGDFLGLFVAIHGYEGQYVLQLEPSPKALRGQANFLHSDISNYVAELIRSSTSWRVEVPKA